MKDKKVMIVDEETKLVEFVETCSSRWGLADMAISRSKIKMTGQVTEFLFNDRRFNLDFLTHGIADVYKSCIVIDEALLKNKKMSLLYEKNSFEQRFFEELWSLNNKKKCNEKENYKIVEMMLCAVFKKHHVVGSHRTRSSRTLNVGFEQINSVCDFECRGRSILLTVEVKPLEEFASKSKQKRALCQVACSLFCQAAWKNTRIGECRDNFKVFGCLIIGLRVFFVTSVISKETLSSFSNGYKPKDDTIFTVFPKRPSGLSLIDQGDRELVFSILDFCKTDMHDF